LPRRSRASAAGRGGQRPLLMASLGSTLREPVCRRPTPPSVSRRLARAVGCSGLKPVTVRSPYASEASVRCFKGSFAMDEKHWQHAEGVLQAMLSSAEPRRCSSVNLRRHYSGPLRSRTSDHGHQRRGIHVPSRGHHWPDASPSSTHRLLSWPAARAGAAGASLRAGGGGPRTSGRIVGEPGAGKSRLLHEFRQRWRTGGSPTMR